MSSLFDRFRGRKELTSAEIAKERLKFVLVTDRSNLSSEKLEEMQREIIQVIKRYIPIDEMEVQINIEQRERKHYLVADVPLHRDPNYGAIEAPGPVPDGDGWVDAESGARVEVVAPSADNSPEDASPAEPDAAPAAKKTSSAAAEADPSSAAEEETPDPNPEDKSE